MEKYNGYNVPDVGEFVSDKTYKGSITTNYCSKADCMYGCIECLFEYPNLTLQWHEARVKAKELEL